MIWQQKLFITENITVKSYQIYGFNRLHGDLQLPVEQLNLIDIVSMKQLATYIESHTFKLELVAYEYNLCCITLRNYQLYI